MMVDLFLTDLLEKKPEQWTSHTYVQWDAEAGCSFTFASLSSALTERNIKEESWTTGKWAHFAT